MNERGKKSNTNYVDSNTRRVLLTVYFRLGDRLGQRSGIANAVVGGVHLPNVHFDLGATCKRLG